MMISVITTYAKRENFLEFENSLENISSIDQIK